MNTGTIDTGTIDTGTIDTATPEIATPHVGESPAAFHNWLTVERALFGLILLVATGVRFFQLTNQPLNLAEAANSWSAWLVASGQTLPMDAAPDSPLLYALYTIAFWIFGGNDFVARSLPVLCGIGTIWLLWYWRDWLGRTTVLLAAALMAFDPWLVAYSRLADSVALTIFLGMLTLTALLRLSELQQFAEAPSVDGDKPEARDEPAPIAPPSRADHDVHAEESEQGDDAQDGTKPSTPQASGGDGYDVTASTSLTKDGTESWQQWAAIGFGLLVVSGPQMWNWLVVLGLFVLVVLPMAVGRKIISQPTLWLLAAGAAILGATGWLAHPEGVGAISTSLTVWLQSWTAGAEPYSLAWFWIRLITDEALIVFFGIIGFGALRDHAAPRLRQAHRFFAFWLLWGILLVLLPGRAPVMLAMVGLPLLFFAAAGLARLGENARRGIAWRENGILALVLAILFLSGAFWLASFSNTVTFDDSLARTLLLILILMVLLIVAYALWIDARQASFVALATIGTVLCLWTLSSMWALNHHFEPRHPDGFFQSFTDPDVRTLADAVTMLSAQRHGDPGELPLQVQMAGTPDPVLGWYLREMRNLTWVLAPGASDEATPDVVITLSSEVGAEGLNTSYLGSSYTLREHWLPTLLIGTEVTVPANSDDGIVNRMGARVDALWSARVRNLWRWMIYHKVTTLPPSNQVVLWVASSSETEQ
ncbi:MAG: glycosyltransferase family 39 protein [Caldilineaceae bacterium]|nr:glycosyltransferase family 39 protein [Caldilineaceae bacterium]